MIELATPAPAYAEPWHEPLADRLRKLASGRHRVAYFYEKADNSTFRYRVHNMTEVLNAHEGTSASYFFHADLHRLPEIAELAHQLVICRTRYDHRVNHLVNAFRRQGKRVLFDIDDFVFNPDYVHLVVQTLDLDVSNPQVWDDWFAYITRQGATLKLCDGAITTNEHLAARIHEFAGVDVRVVPNFMNRAQLDLSARVFAEKRGFVPGAGRIHLGYFSGSPSHTRDFAIVKPALAELLEEDERLGVVVVGYIEAGKELERFGNRVVRFPFTDYVNLQRLIGSVEYNLMPLQRNDFTDCKSELKYFEAAAVGTVSIASPSAVYGRTIRDGDNGYIARGHEWADAIRRALRELDAYPAMVARSHLGALPKYAWESQYGAIVSALGIA